MEHLPYIQQIMYRSLCIPWSFDSQTSYLHADKLSRMAGTFFFFFALAFDLRICVTGKHGAGMRSPSAATFISVQTSYACQRHYMLFTPSTWAQAALLADKLAHVQKGLRTHPRLLL